MITKRIFFCLLALSFTFPASGMFMAPQQVPVDRLLKNMEAKLEKDKSAENYYSLARIHYLAFHLLKDEIPAYEDRDQKGDFHTATGYFAGPRARSGPMDEGVAAKHAVDALKNFNTVMQLTPDDALCQLGIASLYDEFLAWKEDYHVKDSPAELNISQQDVWNAYAKAFTMGMKKDTNFKEMPLAGLEEIVSYGAATGLVNLSKTLPPSTKKDKELLAEAVAAIKKFQSLPVEMVTPVVFSFQPEEHLTGLLEPTHFVDFDLRGYGLKERWPWVKPELGFLVWDPAHSGAITSARQLFGSYTFQLFWKTGYDALAALDDNGDGQLAGAELKGISVWFDRNGDGKSTPDEVTPVEELGIVSISTRQESQDGIHPTNPRGITLNDGRILRSWDWIASPQSAYSTVSRNH